jgi:hypothetical protein
MKNEELGASAPQVPGSPNRSLQLTSECVTSFAFAKVPPLSAAAELCSYAVASAVRVPNAPLSGPGRKTLARGWKIIDLSICELGGCGSEPRGRPA